MKKKRGENPLHARCCKRESVPKRRKPPGRKLAIPGKSPGEGRIRARRIDSPDRKPEELPCLGPSDSGRALRMFLLIADPPTTLPMGAVQLTELRPAYRVSVGVPFAHKQPSVLSTEGCFLSKRRSEKRR